jgi:hypothetical protein
MPHEDAGNAPRLLDAAQVPRASSTHSERHSLIMSLGRIAHSISGPNPSVRVQTPVFRKHTKGTPYPLPSRSLILSSPRRVTIQSPPFFSHRQGVHAGQFMERKLQDEEGTIFHQGAMPFSPERLNCLSSDSTCVWPMLSFPLGFPTLAQALWRQFPTDAPGSFSVLHIHFDRW